MSILIKRYANRKLYNTQSSRYITLKGIATLLEQGEEVRVIDNETGEDITSVALSQILVDSERSNSEPPSSLLTQIMERGGDVLYDVLKKGVGEAGGIDLQDRFRRIIQADDRAGEDAQQDAETSGAKSGASDRRRLSDWIAYASPDFDAVVENSVERVFKLLDLPRRKDVRSLNQNLERVARAVENLERTLATHDTEPEPPTE
jgi:polyhydroxyalkanoate synthesis repressor PhaR